MCGCVCVFFLFSPISRTHTHTLCDVRLCRFSAFFFSPTVFFSRAPSRRRRAGRWTASFAAHLPTCTICPSMAIRFGSRYHSLSLSLSLSRSPSVSSNSTLGARWSAPSGYQTYLFGFFLFWLSHFPMTSRHQPLRIKQTKKLPSVSLTTVRKKTNKNKTLSSSRPDCHFALLKKKAVSISEADLARHLTGFETAIFFLSTDFSARTSSAGLCAFFCFLFTSFDGRSNRVPFLFFLATIRIPRAMFSCSFPRSQPTLSAQFSGHYVNGHFNFNAISFFFLPFKGGAGAGPRPSVQRIRSISTARRISSECPQQNELSLSLSLSFSLGPIPR